MPFYKCPGRHSIKRRGREELATEQLVLAWEVLLEAWEEVLALPSLDMGGRLALDYRVLGLSARVYPMRLLHRGLRRAGVRGIAELADERRWR